MALNMASHDKFLSKTFALKFRNHVVQPISIQDRKITWMTHDLIKMNVPFWLTNVLHMLIVQTTMAYIFAHVLMVSKAMESRAMILTSVLFRIGNNQGSRIPGLWAFWFSSERYGYSGQRIPSVLLKVIAWITKGVLYANVIKDLLKAWVVAQMNIVPKGSALAHVLILTNAMLEHIRFSPISPFINILTLIGKFPAYEQDRFLENSSKTENLVGT